MDRKKSHQRLKTHKKQSSLSLKESSLEITNIKIRGENETVPIHR